jgi:hypothetical protein
MADNQDNKKFDELRNQAEKLNRQLDNLGGNAVKNVDDFIKSFGGGIEGAKDAIFNLREQIKGLDTDINYFKGFGARRLMSENNRTYALDDNNGGHRTNFSFDLTELSVSPAISVGDVLVMRGDTIHRSQDTNTHRIAISIRCFKRV